MPPRATFPKAEKLKSRKQIEALFAAGHSFACGPVRVKYTFVKSADSSVQAGMAVSKKHFKTAVARNKIKRQMREAYRLQKNALLQNLAGSGFQLQIFFMYNEKTPVPYAALSEAIGRCLAQLHHKMPHHEEHQ